MRFLFDAKNMSKSGGSNTSKENGGSKDGELVGRQQKRERRRLMGRQKKRTK